MNYEKHNRTLQHRGLLILKEVLRQASSSIKKQSYHHSQVAKLVDAVGRAKEASTKVTGSNPVLTTKIKVMNNSHIPLEDMLDDLRITNEEIMEFEEENKVLSKNRERNRVQIYMNEGRILQRQKFVSQLEQIIEETYPNHKKEKI